MRFSAWYMIWNTSSDGVNLSGCSFVKNFVIVCSFLWGSKYECLYYCFCTYFYSPVFVMLWRWKLVLLLTFVSIQNSIFLVLWGCLFQKKIFWMWMFVLLPNIRVSPFENAHADVYLYRTLLFSDFSPSEKEIIPSVCITKRNVK